VNHATSDTRWLGVTPAADPFKIGLSVGVSGRSRASAVDSGR
jgi:hypothetical protein